MTESPVSEFSRENFTIEGGHADDENGSGDNGSGANYPDVVIEIDESRGETNETFLDD